MKRQIYSLLIQRPRKIAHVSLSLLILSLMLSMLVLLLLVVLVVVVVVEVVAVVVVVVVVVVVAVEVVGVEVEAVGEEVVDWMSTSQNSSHTWIARVLTSVTIRYIVSRLHLQNTTIF